MLQLRMLALRQKVNDVAEYIFIFDGNPCLISTEQGTVAVDAL